MVVQAKPPTQLTFVSILSSRYKLEFVFYTTIIYHFCTLSAFHNHRRIMQKEGFMYFNCLSFSRECALANRYQNALLLTVDSSSFCFHYGICKQRLALVKLRRCAVSAESLLFHVKAFMKTKVQLETLNRTFCEIQRTI